MFETPSDVDYGALYGEEGEIVQFDLGRYLEESDGEYFMKKLAIQFYSTMRQAIVAFDSESPHAILSDRFAWFGKFQIPYSPDIAGIAAHYSDVLCFNLYVEHGTTEEAANQLKHVYQSLVAEDLARPFMITEFSYHADQWMGYECCMSGEEPLWIPNPNCGGECNDPRHPDYHYPEVITGHEARGTAYTDFMTGMVQAKASAPGQGQHHFIAGLFWYNAIDHEFASASRNLPLGDVPSGRYTKLTQNWGFWNPRHPAYVGAAQTYTELATAAGSINCAAQRARTGLTTGWFGGTCDPLDLGGAP